MKRILFISIALISFTFCVKGQILPDVEKEDIIRDIYFLASDELQGRKTGEMGNLVAARYIAEQFRELGLVSPEGIDDYYQSIPFEEIKFPEMASVILQDTILSHGDQVLMLGGAKNEFTAPLVFVDQGWVDDTLDQYSNLDVKGKIVLATFGIPGSQDPTSGFSVIRKKRKDAEKKGAVGLIEIYAANFPWSMIKNFMNKDQLVIGDPDATDPDFLYVLSEYKFKNELQEIKENNTVEVKIENSGISVTKSPSPNVVAWLEGTDSLMKDEYVILSAHFDHVGTKSGPDDEDNIFNGARDNAIGVASILAAADYFKENPPKRSLLFIAFNAEEIGLLGSEYYAENPVLPLNKAIFNMNIDGAGYNDTSRVTIIGHDRVGVFDIFQEAAEMVGLRAEGDPVPEQGLFDRSDNVNFAKKGIPAPTYSPGISSFDQELMKYYHQTLDNPESLDYNYILKYIQSYIYTSERIANLEIKPKWKDGDKYEKAYNKLYGLD